MRMAARHASLAAMLQNQLSVRVVSSEGAFSLLDVRARAGLRLPPVVHRHEEATVHVDSGLVAIDLDGLRHDVGPGMRLSLPRDRPFALEVLVDARLLCVASPGGIERLAVLARDPLPDPDDVAALLAAAGVSLVPRGLASRA